jgi:hypothetical protein
MKLRLAILAMAAVGIFALSAGAADIPADPAFDKPVAVKHVRLGPAQTQPVSYKEIRCSYFTGIMVKEWDEQEIGDKEISYVAAPDAAKPPPCQKAALPGERKLPVSDLTVYFLGYAGGAIFLADADGANNTIGFYIFDPKTGQKRFTDTIKLDSKFGSVANDNGTLKLGYIRALTGPCSVVTGGADCWTKIAQQSGYTGPAPDCVAGYKQAAESFAADACKAQGGDQKKCLTEQLARRTDWDKAPSVVAFDVTASIAPDNNATITPAGSQAQCWPSD